MEKYNNTKTVLSISNKSAILILLPALIISTSAIYFIVASQDYSDLVQSESHYLVVVTIIIMIKTMKAGADAVSTTNEMIFFVIVGIAYIAAGIWMLENKYYSKMPYS